MQTVKEAAEENAEKYWVSDSRYKSSIASFNAGVEFAQRWIPVEDELPIKSGNYLCILNGSIFSIAFFTEHKEWIIYKTGQIPEHITSRFLSHWRPIDYALL